MKQKIFTKIFFIFFFIFIFNKNIFASDLAVNPSKVLSRQEAAVMLMNTSKILDIKHTIDSKKKFTDSYLMADWFISSINFISDNKIMQENNVNDFAPLDDFTREQAFVAFLYLYRFAENNAKINFNLNLDLNETNFNKQEPIIYKELKISGKPIRLNDSSLYVFNTFGKPKKIIKSSYGWDWNIFYTDYSDLLFVGLKEEQVVSLVTNAKTFLYDNYVTIETPKNQVSSNFYENFIFDGDKVEGIYLTIEYDRDIDKPESLANEIFFLSNSFRYKNGFKPFEEDVFIEKAAIYHSKDMAINNYFMHDSLDGKTPLDRIMSTGIFVKDCSENIAKGFGDGIYAYEALINSPNHRIPLISEYKMSAVGAAVSYDGTFYYTQLFANPLN